MNSPDEDDYAPYEPLPEPTDADILALIRALKTDLAALSEQFRTHAHQTLTGDKPHANE